MRSEAESSGERLQYDTEGNPVGIMIVLPNRKPMLMLEPGFMLVKRTDTREMAIWNSNKAKLVEFR